MRAAFIRKHGDIDAIELGELPEPTPGPTDVVVKVHAASLNHLDVWVREARAAGPFPFILGSDAAGTVASVGAAVRSLKPGDEVVLYPAVGCGACDSCLAGEVSLCAAFKIVGAGTQGVFADLAMAPEGAWVKKPARLSFEEAACLAVNFVTAFRMVVSRGRVRPGQTVLVTGIGGGVAIAALQTARLAGARVIVTSSSQVKLERARELGADAGILYRSEDVAERVLALTGGRGVDLVIDSAGEATYAQNLASLRKGGRLVCCGITTGANPPADLRQIYVRQLEVIGSTLGSRTELAEVLRLAESGQLRPVIDAVYPFEALKEATRRMEAGEQLGKLVVHF